MWWRPLAIAGAVLLVALMVMFFGPTKVVPIAFALATVYVSIGKPALFAAT
jgi:hypothetical protein